MKPLVLIVGRLAKETTGVRGKPFAAGRRYFHAVAAAGGTPLMLPPLMFSEEEIEALVLGSHWVARRADGSLGQAARNALAKIGAVLPADLKDSLDSENLMVGPGRTVAAGDSELPRIRTAIRTERMLDIA